MENENYIDINEGLRIPRREVWFRFSTSRGPGGQHANRTASKVTLLFDINQSPSLDEDQRALLMTNLGNRIDSKGILSIEVQESRSQVQNRELALERFQSLLSAALVRPRKRRDTKPSNEVKEQRLADKKRRSAVKKERGSKWHNEG